MFFEKRTIDAILNVMRLDKNKALKLRLQGKSYGEISVALNIPKSTLSDWFSRLEISQKAKERINNRVYEKSIKGLIKRNKLQTHLAQERAKLNRETAKKEIPKLSKKELFLTGVALYWAEGYKRPQVHNGRIITSHPVSMTNSDPNLIKIFLRFLREICEVPEEKISANVRIYQHQNEAYLLEFWHQVTNIPNNRFQRFYYNTNKSSSNKRPLNISPYGTIQIRVNNTELYHKIMGWIDGLANSI